jgi:hypothetical protein
MTQPNEQLLAVQKLAAWFNRNGYVRRQNAARQAAEGQLYKKGDEVRFVAKSKSELAMIRRLLRTAGFEPRKPFAKHSGFVQPVYGRETVKRFINLMLAEEGGR